MPEKKKILLLVSGMSPQIITETLYALITQAQPWVPDEVHLITTQQGRSNAIGQLLNEKTRIFEQLLSDYAVVQPVLFDQNTIHIIEHSGKQLEDLRTPDENQAAADCISEKIRQFTQDENIELHVSLAGGRKTMGFYAGYALSLFGRAQDKLSHVLVSDRYESSDFYYPAPIPDTHWIKARDGSTLDTHRAQVWLADIAFVRMRDGLPEKLLKGGSSFSETITLANKASGHIKFIVNPLAGQVECNGEIVNIEKALMPLLTWAAERHIQKLPPIEALVEGDKDKERVYANELLRIADSYDISLSIKTQTALDKNGFTQKDLQEKVSKIVKKFESSLGYALASRCKLANTEASGGKGYALPENIYVEIKKGRV